MRWSTSSRAGRSNCSYALARRRECLLAIHTAGDIFGELCLSGLGARLETATAMEETNLKQIPCPKFFARLGSDALFAGFVQYLAVRIADQQQVIANLVTVDSEQRQDAATGAQARQERPAEHTHRTEDFTMKNYRRWSVPQGPGSACLCSGFGIWG